MTRLPPPLPDASGGATVCLQKFILLLLTEGRGPVAPPRDQNRDKEASLCFYLHMDAKRQRLS